MQHRRNLSSIPPVHDVTEMINNLSDETKSKFRDKVQLRRAKVVEVINYRTISTKFWKKKFPDAFSTVNLALLALVMCSSAECFFNFLILKSRRICYPSATYVNISCFPLNSTYQLVQRFLRLDGNDDLEPQFTLAKVIVVVINLETFKTTGPHGVVYANLKHLGPKGISFLVDIHLVHSVECYSFLCKRATKIFRRKSGAPPSVAGSYRPITFCTPSKRCERLVLNKVIFSLLSVFSSKV